MEASTATSVAATLRRGFDSFFLLRDAEKRARAYTLEQRAEIVTLSAAATARVRAARELETPALSGVAASLYRQAVVLRLRAAAIAGVAARPGEVVAPFVESTDDLLFDRMSPDERVRARDALRVAERELRGAVEPRSLAYLRGARFGRVGALVSLILYGAGVWIAHAFAPPNVALHRALAISGDVAGRTPASALVDDVVDSTTPVRIVGTPPAVEIDLAGAYRISSVAIANREDEHFDACLPLVVETSTDHVTWAVLKTQERHFTKLTIDARGTIARWVRVKGGGAELGLNEIQVFGRYAK
jgi:hypothetical protein